MTKILGAVAFAAIVSAAPAAQSAVPTHSEICASLLDELTGSASPAMAGQATARLHTWARQRVETALLTLRGFVAAMASQDVLLATRQLGDVAASARLLAHDEQLIEQANARHCGWAPEAARSLKAH